MAIGDLVLEIELAGVGYAFILVERAETWRGTRAIYGRLEYRQDLAARFDLRLLGVFLLI